MGINKVILIGNLGRDPEVRYTQAGQAVAQLNLATTRTWTDKGGEKQEETDWHRISVWGKQAEHCKQYLSKGRQVYIEGRLKTSSYEQDGIKKYSTEIVAQNVQFLGSKADNVGAGGGGGGSTFNPGGFDDKPEPDPNQMNLGEKAGGGDDIPF